MWIDLHLDVSYIEEIQQRLGKIFATNSIANSVLEKLERKRDVDSRELVVWKTKIALDNHAYVDFLAEFSYDSNQTIAQIEHETKSLLKILHKLDQGASYNDANLLANARWIRLNTKHEPLIISDDRDLLTCAHVLSSFFGLTLGFLSSFEVLRLAELDEPFTRCCSHFGLSQSLAGIEYEWSKAALETEISSALRKARIACHPSPRAEGTKALKIIRR